MSQDVQKREHQKSLTVLMFCFRSQLESAQKETEQLKSLITQLDSTREELVGQNILYIKICFYANL